MKSLLLQFNRHEQRFSIIFNVLFAIYYSYFFARRISYVFQFRPSHRYSRVDIWVYRIDAAFCEYVYIL